MKVEICKNIDIDTEVDINLDDITAAIYEEAERLAAIEHASMDATHSTRAVLRFISDLHQALKSIPDGYINKMPEHHKVSILTAFGEQIKRFDSQKAQITIVKMG